MKQRAARFDFRFDLNWLAVILVIAMNMFSILISAEEAPFPRWGAVCIGSSASCDVARRSGVLSDVLP